MVGCTGIGSQWIMPEIDESKVALYMRLEVQRCKKKHFKI